MIFITKSVAIKKDFITYQPIKSSGPGGQNVNKVSTAIMLKYHLEVHLYPNWFILQLKSNAGSQLSKKDVIICDDIGMNSKYIEAEAFAYLAVRCLLNLDISYPTTTGVQTPISGGSIFRPSD